MRFGKYRSNEKILHDEYFGEQPPAACLLAVRLVLLCLMSSSLVMVFCDLYGGGMDMLIPAVTAAALSGIVYILASLFPAPIIYGAVTAAAGGILWVLRERVLTLAPYFYDYILLKLDSRLLKTSDFLLHDPLRIKSGVMPERQLMNEAFFWAAVLLAVICSVIFTAAVRTRFHLSVPVIIAAIITAPAVAAEIAGFLPSFLLYVVSVFAFEAVTTSYELDSGFIYGSLTSAHLADMRSDHEYRKRTRYYTLAKKADSDTVRFHRYSGNMIAMAVISAAAFFGAAALIPEGKGINYQQVFDTVAAIGNSAVDTVGNIFGVAIGAADDRGYFSSDRFGDVSDSISLQPPGSSDRPVIEVKLSRSDIPVYLRGDIGTEYTDNSWVSVSAFADRYSAAVDNGFYPESEYQVFRRLVTARGGDPDRLIPLQMVSVKYLRSTSVVFQPVATYELTYKDSTVYNYFGDFILRTKNGAVRKCEGLALTPAITRKNLSGFVSEAMTAETASAALLSDRTISAPDMSVEYYLGQINGYRGFIESAYKKQDPVISDFVRGVTVSQYTGSGGYTDAEKRLNAALSLCDYFKDNFTYSLTADNGEDILSGFLYDTHEGHCALFATAMTLALREMGIPARYVTGYVVYPGSGTTDESGNCTYTLTERELHAWTEVYFRGIGWLPFDPTAEVPGYAELVYGDPGKFTEGEAAEAAPAEEAAETTETSAETTAAPEEYDPDTTTVVGTDPDTTAAPEDDGDPLSDDSSAPDGSVPDAGSPPAGSGESLFLRLLPVIAIMAVIAALAVVTVLFFRSLTDAEKRKISSFRSLPAYNACEDMYDLVMKLLEKEGLTPGAEQFYDFAERVDGSIEMKGVNAFMMDVMPTFEKCEFGTPDTAPISEEEREAVYRYTSAVYGKVMDDLSSMKRFFFKISLFL